MQEGWRLLMRQRPAEAAHALKRAQINAPHHLHCHIGLAEAYAALSRHQDVRETVIRSCTALREHPELLVRQLRADIALHDISAALETWERLEKLPWERNVLFYDLSGDLWLHWHHEADVPSSPIKNRLLTCLLNQPDQLPARHVATLGRLLFQQLEFAREQFDALNREVRDFCLHSGIDLFASRNLATLALTYDWVEKPTKRELLRHYLFQFDRFAHLPYIFWEQQHKCDLSRKRENIDLAAEILPQMLDDHGSDDDLFTALLVANICNEPLTEQVRSLIQGRLTSAAVTQSYYEDFNIIGQAPAARAPTYQAPTSSSKLRIALCLSGQMRGYRHAWPSFSILGLGAHDVTVFLHTWKDSGVIFPAPPKDVRLFTGNFGKAYRDVWNHHGQDGMMARYPRFLKLFDTASAEATKEELCAFYATPHVVVEDANEPHFSDFSNSTKMHYKIFEAHKLARNSGKDFDLIVRLRPDLIFNPCMQGSFDWHEAWRRSTHERRLYADDRPYMFPHIDLCMGDQFAAGTPEVMDAYASTYAYTREANQRGMQHFPHDFMPHRNLAMACLYQGIPISQCPLLHLSQHAPGYIPAADQLLSSLQEDCVGRMDVEDRALLAAAASDWGAEKCS